MSHFQWSPEMLQQPSASTSTSTDTTTSPSSTPNLHLPMTPQHAPGPFDFGQLGPLGPFQFNFAAQPLPSINSFGAFPDFRHHPFMAQHHQAEPTLGGHVGLGLGLESKKPFELASAVPRFDFSAQPKRTSMTNPAPPSLSPSFLDQPHSPASSASGSAVSSTGSGQSRSPSHSHSPEPAPLNSLPIAPTPTYASTSYFPAHLAYPQPTQSHSNPYPYGIAGPSSSSSPIKAEGSGSSSALDMLAVAAGTSAHPPPPPPPTSAVTLTLEELQRRHDEQQEKITAGLKRQAEEAEEARRKKKRIGRGLDPGKTRTLIFPPTLPPRNRVPKEEDEYSTRSVPSENLYAPRYTKGKDSRARVAFCEYCAEPNLPTRMSGYGYHLLHTHNLSSHPPYIMPSPLGIRTIATNSQPNVYVLEKEDACAKASPGLEGECPWKGEGAGGMGVGVGGEGRCALGGWHKLNGWREAMNAHLGGKGLVRVESGAGAGK